MKGRGIEFLVVLFLSLNEILREGFSEKRKRKNEKNERENYELTLNSKSLHHGTDVYFFSLPLSLPLFLSFFLFCNNKKTYRKPKRPKSVSV